MYILVSKVKVVIWKKLKPNFNQNLVNDLSHKALAHDNEKPALRYITFVCNIFPMLYTLWNKIKRSLCFYVA
jgi:hypothetical protein